MTTQESEVDVLAVMDAEIQRAGGEAYQAGRDLTEARAAVAKVFEAAKEMRHCLQVLRDDCQAEPEDIAALRRADTALRNAGVKV